MVPMMHKLDVKNLGCPIPTINLRKALKNMALGDEITVVCNAKDILNDLRALVRSAKNLLKSDTVDSTGKVPVYTLVIEKAAP